MEDNFDWIAGLIAVAGLVFSAVQSIRKRAREAESEAGTNPSPNATSRFDMPEIEPESTSADYYSLENQYNAEESARRVPISPDAIPAVAPTDGLAPESPLGEILGEEFDLCRAVIEAEILTRKYN